MFANNDPSLPEGISRLKNLEFLYLNGFSQIPIDILSLNLQFVHRDKLNLGELRRRRTSVQDQERTKNKEERLRFEANDERAWAKKIQEESLQDKFRETALGIYISPDNMQDPPAEIITRGHDAIYAYFRDRQQEEIEINEAKLLMVGHGGAGKTSLLKRMVGDDFDPNELQTHGINIRTLHRETDTMHKITLKAWDFGGQEIMHATHQFFLSKRSVYILVLDGRKDEQAEYWLKHIESFGGDSPIVVVLNKCDENPGFDVNRRFLSKKYTGIVGFVRLSCKNDYGIDKFEDQLIEALKRVEIIQTRWPSNWLHAKAMIEALDAPFIGLSEYRKICDKAEVKIAATQKTLAQFLNDLGVVVHFSDFALQDTHVLNPRWLTGAVYKILNSKMLAESHGLFSLADLPECLDENNKLSLYPAECHSFIIGVMQKFELCYLLDHETILVPDLLQVGEPEFNFPEEDVAQLRLVYPDFIPRSVLPRLIVRMHEQIDGELRWRSGVVFENHDLGTRALIRADFQARIIDVVVSGRGRRDFLAVLRSEFRHIHSKFERFNVSERIPLPDNMAITVSYDHLVRLEEQGESKVFPEDAEAEYQIAELLGSVRVAKSWNEKELMALLKLAISETDNEHTAYEIANNIVTLQPNFFGVGVNFNELIKKVIDARNNN